jgi:hypothetical protein
MSKDGDLRRAVSGWRKSSRSIPKGACVEVAVAGNTLLVRDSVNPAGRHVRFSARAWRAFTVAVVAAEEGKPASPPRAPI